MKDAAELFLAVSEAAERLGVTPRALRLYEGKGLVVPRRTEAGWRVYGHAELERLHLVIALKSMGFPLSRIAAWLKDDRIDLASVLAAQEEALQAGVESAARALSLVRAARARVTEGARLDTAALIELTRETAAAGWTPSAELKRLIERHFSDAQTERIAALDWTTADVDAAVSRWDALIARAEALKNGDPAAPAARQLARDWIAEASRITQGDAGMEASARSLYAEAFARPDSASAMPFSKSVWDFMSAACRALAEHEKEGPIV